MGPGSRVASRRLAATTLITTSTRARPCLMQPVQPFRQQVQVAIAIAERLQRLDGRKQIIAVGSGFAMTGAHEMKLLGEIELSGILRMAAVDHVAERLDAGLGM